MRGLAWLAFLCTALLPCATAWPAAAEKPGAEKAADENRPAGVYETPEEAIGMVSQAVRTSNPESLRDALGPEVAAVFSEMGLLDRMRFHQIYQIFPIHGGGQAPEVKYSQDKMRATVTANRVQAPFPLAKTAKGWVFVADPDSVRAFREKAGRSLCSYNLQMLRNVCHSHARQPANHQRMPARLADLQVQMMWPSVVLTCPAVAKGAHGTLPGSATECDYIYLPGHTLAAEQRQLILAFDRRGNHPGGRNVVLTNGMATWVADEKKFRADLEKTLGELRVSLDLPPASGPADAALEERLTQAMKGLSSEDFTAREAAHETLLKAGEAARKQIEAGLNSDDPETVARCRRILEQLALKDEMRVVIAQIRQELGLDPPSPAPAAPAPAKSPAPPSPPPPPGEAAPKDVTPSR